MGVQTLLLLLSLLMTKFSKCLDLYNESTLYHLILTLLQTVDVPFCHPSFSVRLSQTKVD